ncbi:hypothetical protein K3495_g6913 [Podosphaera aphanis]|nr:hypothetical protein K3495_g6913 [Podosphaera aphanis]
MILYQKLTANPDSSPFQSSPFTSSIDGNSSPRLFWSGRDPVTPNRLNSENFFAGKESSPSPTRRTSLEKLQKASRVKNSNMFAREQKREYDPTCVPVVERPLIKTWQGNAFGGNSPDILRSPRQTSPYRHWRGNSVGSGPGSPLPCFNRSPSKTPTQNGLNETKPRNREQVSPTKSSLSAGRYRDSADAEAHSEDASAEERHLPPGRKLHRHAKSVTFDAAPPQVNEYEMATPDLSSVGTGSRENSLESQDDDDVNECDYSLEHDNSFDASLEDIEKTPVVGPEDWRNESPSLQSNGFQTDRFEDLLHDASHRQSSDPRQYPLLAPTERRTDSLNSNSEQRPLPPIPRLFTPEKRINSSSSVGLSAAAERAKNSPRNLPSPPLAPSVTKADIHGLSGGRMSLGERLKLMMLQDEENPKSDLESQRDRRMRRASNRDRSSETPERKSTINVHEDEGSMDELQSIGNYQLPPRISRESILRKVKGQSATYRESGYKFSSPITNSSPDHSQYPDPDVPIPSTENEWGFADENKENDDNTGGVTIKREPDEESSIDIRDIPDIPLQSCCFDESEDDSMLQHEETQSQYSEPSSENQPHLEEINHLLHDRDKIIPPDPATTEKDISKWEDVDFQDEEKKTISSDSIDQGTFTDPKNIVESNSKIQAEFQSANEVRELSNCPETPTKFRRPSSMAEQNGSSWGSGGSTDEFEVGTPESVIHHRIWDTTPRESPSIPEQVATIRSASGSSKLKTRPSATPSDLESMREARRNFSGEVPLVPPIPDKHRDRPLSVDREFAQSFGSACERSPSFKRSLTLDIGNDISLNLENDFDRVVEAQKRGYLMRQNTKIVVASSDIETESSLHGARSAENSPLKLKHSESWTVEPWNGQRRKSSAHSKTNPRNRQTSGSAPPLPGQKSSSTSVTDDSSIEEANERGRLFVKVLGVKDLNLPLPISEQTWFNLTLDNGVHCVTTAWLELGRNAPVGQEFELVVPKDLEFQLTLNVKLEKPIPKRVESPTKGFKVHKPSTFSKVFSSPKKRKEIEARFREEEKRNAQLKEQEALAKRKSNLPTTWDLLSPFAAEDGSFGRSYVCLKDHESRCYGRPYVVDVSCFNEWATEQVNNTSSVMSKRCSTHIQRRAPYKVAKLELQLLFVPMPKGATDDDMPKSMNSCIREMREAEKALSRSWEGHLSQQGGDCPYWRRRYFKLVGSKLTAFHETTRQPRVTINLANACKLIDDRSALIQKETIGKGGKRRKSGFAEEEEGYMFVEEGFRIRFRNGEVIDFYADTSADKESWMRVLDGCIGKESDTKRAWCSLVLKREQSIRRHGEQDANGRKASRLHQRTKSSLA